MDDEAGLGHLRDAVVGLYLGAGERDAREARHADALAVREERRAVDRLVEAREARRRLAGRHGAVTPGARVVARVAVQRQVEHLRCSAHDTPDVRAVHDTIRSYERALTSWRQSP